MNIKGVEAELCPVELAITAAVGTRENGAQLVGERIRNNEEYCVAGSLCSGPVEKPRKSMLGVGTLLDLVISIPKECPYK